MHKDLKLLFGIIIMIVLLAYVKSLNTSETIRGYISVYTGYNHNLDYNYFHIEEFITENPDYFSIVSPESILPCIEAFEGAYYIDNSMIQPIIEHENVVDVHPVFIFSVSGKDSENNSFSFDVAAVESSIIEVFENEGIEGRFLKEADEDKIVINQFMKEKYGFEVGDNIQFIHDFYWKQNEYEVIGIMNDPISELPGDSALVLMNNRELFRMLDVSEDEELYNFLYVCTKNPVQALNRDELVQYLNTVFPDALISARNIQVKWKYK